MTQPTPTAAPPALLNITLGVMLALMLGWFFHIASGVLVPMVLGLMISYVVMAILLGTLFLEEALLPRHFSGMALTGAGLVAIDGRLLRATTSIRKAP